MDHLFFCWLTEPLLVALSQLSSQALRQAEAAQLQYHHSNRTNREQKRGVRQFVHCGMKLHQARFGQAIGGVPAKHNSQRYGRRALSP